MARDLSKGKSANMIKDIAGKSREENGKKTIKNISVDLIDISEDNEKVFSCDDIEKLVDAIKRNGFQGTVEVYAKKDGRYGLLSGHRRYLSAKEVGMSEIPCEIVEEPSETQKAEILIMSNIASRDLSPIEKGRALTYYEEKVLKHDKTVTGDKRAELAKRFGIAPSQVHKLKSLTRLIPEIQELINKEQVAYVHIYNVSTLDKDTQMQVYKNICNKINENGVDIGISGKEVVRIVGMYVKKKDDKGEEGNTSQEQNDSIAPLNEKPIDMPEPEEDIPVGENMVEPLSFMNRKSADDLFEPEYDEVIKQKPQKDMLYNEKRLFISSQNLRVLLKSLVGSNKIKLKNDEVIEELKELQSLLNELF